MHYESLLGSLESRCVLTLLIFVRQQYILSGKCRDGLIKVNANLFPIKTEFWLKTCKCRSSVKSRQERSLFCISPVTAFCKLHYTLPLLIFGRPLSSVILLGPWLMILWQVKSIDASRLTCYLVNAVLRFHSLFSLFSNIRFLVSCWLDFRKLLVKNRLKILWLFTFS